MSAEYTTRKTIHQYIMLPTKRLKVDCEVSSLKANDSRSYFLLFLSSLASCFVAALATSHCFLIMNAAVDAAKM
ncbi:hypothetical protein L917_19736 [Phytophthora nicotianae]|uniref:Uncharacterized protein n=1 Tax=Phytophthora nicotianae TaxID=4792 RepID=W2K570_PHYNI|nr:hypothetical protein L917_19736 [Phytophthora nicotianae]ETM32924.1 hypothetical protein L914_19780 [Phytophthora nicotianae]